MASPLGRSISKKSRTTQKNPLDDEIPVLCRMTEDELAKYKGRLAKPDVETENATDAKAVSQLSSDVR